MKIICGADDILGIANPKYTQKTRLFNNIKRLDADIILLDLGAGTSFTTIDFFLYAQNKIVVLTPQMTSMQNAYGFIKSSLYRSLNDAFKKESQALELINRASVSTQGEKIDSIAKLYEEIGTLDTAYQDRLMECINNINIKLVANMVRDPKEKNVSTIIKSVAKNYLSLEMEDLGAVQYENTLNSSINNMTAYLTDGKDSIARGNFYDIAYGIVKKTRITQPLFQSASSAAQ